MRIDADAAYKYFKPDIAASLEVLSTRVNTCLSVMSKYILSPFVTTCGWKGELEIRGKLESSRADLLHEIESFISVIQNELKVDNKVSNGQFIVDDHVVDASLDSISGSELQNSSPKHKSNTYSEIKLSEHKVRYGNAAMESWHRMYPMRAFCSLAVQSSMQTISLTNETLTFMDALSTINATDGLLTTRGKYESVDEEAVLSPLRTVAPDIMSNIIRVNDVEMSDQTI